MSSAVYRKSHNTFHVDQQRRIDAGSWLGAYAANAARIDSRVMSANASSAGLPPERGPRIGAATYSSLSNHQRVQALSSNATRMLKKFRRYHVA